MPASFLFIASLLAFTHIDAAPAPGLSKQKLEDLKKRLPRTLNDWVKVYENSWLNSSLETEVVCKPELRVFRRIGPNRAKVVILFAAFGIKKDDRFRLRSEDVVLNIYLSYQDGCWSTESFEAFSQEVESKKLRSIFAFLVMAIDEEAEKPVK